MPFGCRVKTWDINLRSYKVDVKALHAGHSLGASLDQNQLHRSKSAQSMNLSRNQPKWPWLE